MPSLVEIGESGSGEEDENVKSLRKQRRQRKTDKFWSEKYTWAFGSGELKNVPSSDKIAR